MIGVAGLGALVTTGSWFKRQADLRQQAEVQAITAEIVGLKNQATQYHERMANLRWNAAKVRAVADAEGAEPLKSWLRERSRKFDEFVDRIDQGGAEATFTRVAGEIDDLCRAGKVVDARKETLQLVAPKFPSAADFRELQQEFYIQPLAQFSRANPAYYRAFQTYETEAAKNDVAALRTQLATSNMDAITPQSLVMLELLSAVAAPDDPLLADLSSAASAADYFDNPDVATRRNWREATQAMRRSDWPTAFARMQSISLTTVRTRQPFRAAYGRAMLKNRPDDSAAAYPFMQEAAAAGDAEARSWVAQEDLAKGRFTDALRWLEASVAAGDVTAVPQLVKVYAMDRQAVPRDLVREAGFLQRIVISAGRTSTELDAVGAAVRGGRRRAAFSRKGVRVLSSGGQSITCCRMA